MAGLPAPRLRSFGDLDLLTDDAAGRPGRADRRWLPGGLRARRATSDIHHLRPLRWPGLPLSIELHTRPNWPAASPAPTTEELIAAAVPGRLGVAGVTTLPPEHHTLVLAAHAWEHQALGRLGNLIDVAVTLRRADAEVGRPGAPLGLRRMWRTTRAAIGAVVRAGGARPRSRCGRGTCAAPASPRVFEWHIKGLLAPLVGLPGRGAGRADRASPGESRRMQLSRGRRSCGEPARRAQCPNCSLRTSARAGGARLHIDEGEGVRMTWLRLTETELHWREIDGEIIALEGRGSLYVAANRAGAVLWRALIEWTTREGLADRLFRM